MSEKQNLNEVMPKPFEVYQNGTKVFESDDKASAKKYIVDNSRDTFESAVGSGTWSLSEKGNTILS